MSTFDGLVEEIPGISIDEFTRRNLASSVFFLSHCHTDHMKGLKDLLKMPERKPNQIVYCSVLSKQFLIGSYDLDSKTADTMKTLDVNTPFVVIYKFNDKDYYLTVTCIPAGHCPGSVMFSFEFENKSILYTGDFRIHSNDFPKLKPLHMSVDGKLVPKKFDNIYLDTTFFNDQVKFLPNRKDSLREIVRVTKEWLNEDKDNIVRIEISAKYGSEFLFMELAKILGLKIHVLAEVYKAFRFIPELEKCIVCDPYATPIHACMMKREPLPMKCRPGTSEEKILTVVPSVMFWIWKNKDLTEATGMWDGSRRFYSCYSTHSSHQELLNFIKYFQPKELHPCVVDKKTSFNEFKKEINDILNENTKKRDVNGDHEKEVAKFSKLPLSKRQKLVQFSSSDDDND